MKKLTPEQCVAEILAKHLRKPKHPMEIRAIHKGIAKEIVNALNTNTDVTPRPDRYQITREVLEEYPYTPQKILLWLDQQEAV